MKKLLIFVFITLLSLTAYSKTDIEDKLIAQIPTLSGYESLECVQAGDGFVLSLTFEDKNPVRLNVREDGTITDYFEEMPPAANNRKRLPSVSKAEASEIALQFVQAAAADIMNQINTQIYTNTYDFSSECYNIRYARNVNGINYPADGINISVHGRAGRVVRFYRIWSSDIDFVPVDEIISHSNAEQKFKENIGLTLRYGRKTENSRVVAYPMYVPSNTDSIDAVSGNAISPVPVRSAEGYHEMLALFKKNIPSGAPELEGEIEEGLVSGRDARLYASKIRELKIGGNYTPQQAKYYKNPSGEYLITLDFSNLIHRISVTLNARTLDIIGFLNEETAEKPSGNPIDKEIIKKSANNFLLNYKTEYMDQLAPPIITAAENGDKKACAVTYERIVNSLPYKSNYIRFFINSQGDIISMSSLWDNIDFDSGEDIINPDMAYDIFFKSVGLRLVYMRTGGSKAEPVYTVNPQIPAVIDAKTGLILSYDGKPAKPGASLNYVGLDEHYARQPATVLADCDIFVSQGNVVLDDAILQKNFIAMLSCIVPEEMPIYNKQSGITDEELEMIYSVFLTKGVLESSEIMPDGFVPRAEAVKYLLRAVGYKNVAELEGIFKIPFMDAHKIPPSHYGYIALARGMGLISGSGCYFYPSQNLTNADALILIYNYLRYNN